MTTNSAPAAPSTAADMVAMLRRHYVPDESHPGGIFAPEITDPDRGTRRADLIWLGVTAATGYQLVGHEIKVRRADLLAELDDSTKSDPWQRYCDRWWLVVPDPSLLDGVTLPATWGVLTPPSGRRRRTCTVHRDAPRLRPAEQGPALRALATRAHWMIRDRDKALNLARRDAERYRDRIHELETLVAEHTDRHVRADQELVRRIVRELGGASPDGQKVGDLWAGQVDVDTVIAVLRDVQAADRAVRDLESRRDFAISRLRGIGTSVTEMLDRHAEVSG